MIKHNPKKTHTIKVARKHILAALEDAGKLKFFPKYVIKAFYYEGQDRSIGEFGWQISVVPQTPSIKYKKLSKK